MPKKASTAEAKVARIGASEYYHIVGEYDQKIGWAVSLCLNWDGDIGETKEFSNCQVCLAKAERQKQPQGENK